MVKAGCDDEWLLSDLKKKQTWASLKCIELSGTNTIKNSFEIKVGQISRMLPDIWAPSSRPSALLCGKLKGMVGQGVKARTSVSGANAWAET